MSSSSPPPCGGTSNEALAGPHYPDSSALVVKLPENGKPTVEDTGDVEMDEDKTPTQADFVALSEHSGNINTILAKKEEYSNSSTSSRDNSQFPGKLWMKNAEETSLVGFFDGETSSWVNLHDFNSNDGNKKSVVEAVRATPPVHPPSRYFREAQVWKQAFRVRRKVGLRHDLMPGSDASLESWCDDDKLNNMYMAMLNEMQSGCVFMQVKIPDSFREELYCANPYCPLPNRFLYSGLDCAVLEFVDDGSRIQIREPLRGVAPGLIHLYRRLANCPNNTFRHEFRVARMWFCMWCFFANRFSSHQAELICRMNPLLIDANWHARASGLTLFDIINSVAKYKQGLINCLCQACSGTSEIA